MHPFNTICHAPWYGFQSKACSVVDIIINVKLMLFKRFILALPTGVPSIITIAVIAYLSLADNPVGADEFALFPGADKLAHFLIYFVAASVFILEYCKKRMPHHTHLNVELALMTCAIILGMIMEAGQLLVPETRDFEVQDIVANTLGAAAGWGAMKVWGMHKFRKHFYYKMRHHRSSNDGMLDER